jgi:subtilisin family serine protease
MKPSLPRVLAVVVAGLIALGLLGVTAGVLTSAVPGPHLTRLPAMLAAAITKIAPDDRIRLFADAILDGEAAFLVILEQQADLRPASALDTKEAKGRFVFDALRATAAQTQSELVALLRARGAQVRPFIIVNAIGVHASLDALFVAASANQVARIVADTPAQADRPAPDLPSSPSTGIRQASSVEWGVSDIHAPAVWAMGYTGTGIVIGGQDTGVRWDHTALKNQYRGWNGAGTSHDYNWHDAIHSDVGGSPPGNPCGFDSTFPCDDQGHGTHTVGTVVGDDGAGNQIGVAPGAEWIACHNMDQNWGSPTTYLECFEWFLAPYPIGATIAGGDPAKAPHIINNSWGCPDSEGCVTGQEIISGVQAMRAAGILTVVSAGNHGPGCSTVNDAPAIYSGSFDVGAYDAGGSIASFSSRGPVTLDGSFRLKPDIGAPGVSVRSATNGSTNSYGYSSGTSMAGPHVAGAAALLWNAAPYLVGDVDLTEWVLRLNTQPAFTTQGCGGDTPSSRPNNVWGWGKLDALAVVSATFSLTPTAVLTYYQTVSGVVILDASASTDPESPADDLLIRWDFGNDGVWDTSWSLNKTLTGDSTMIGATVAVEVADPGGRADIGISQVITLNLTYYFPFLALNWP